MHYNPFAYIRSESWTDWKNCWNERSCLWQKTNRTKMTAPTAAPCDIIPLRNSGAGCRKWRKPWSDRQPKTLLPPFIRDYPMKMNCRARVIPSLTKSVFWKATQNRMVLPISNGTRTMDTPVRTSKDPVFKPCLRTLKPGKSERSLSRICRDWGETISKWECIRIWFSRKGVFALSLSTMEWTAHRATMILPLCVISSRFIAINDGVDSA